MQKCKRGGTGGGAGEGATYAVAVDDVDDCAQLALLRTVVDEANAACSARNTVHTMQKMVNDDVQCVRRGGGVRWLQHRAGKPGTARGHARPGRQGGQAGPSSQRDVPISTNRLNDCTTADRATIPTWVHMHNSATSKLR